MKSLENEILASAERFHLDLCAFTDGRLCGSDASKNIEGSTAVALTCTYTHHPVLYIRVLWRFSICHARHITAEKLLTRGPRVKRI
jgi:hypothetical protein